ncbi:hypothetical protein [uncultured Bacteroides sp.]|nr:hypothetical protein [uncultured Bacteroides sp.]
MKQVVLESGLFEIEKGYIIPLKLKCEGGTINEETTRKDMPAKPQRGNKTSRKNSRNEAKNNFTFIISDDSSEAKNSRNEAKNSRKQTKNSENPSVFNENPLKNDENPSKNSGKQAKNDKKRTENDEKQAFFNEKQAIFDGKQAENSGKQVRKTSQKQSEHTDKQVFKYNSFETNNTNTPIYINKEKEKERKNISSTEKEEEKEQEQEKTENTMNDRNVPVRQTLPPTSNNWQDTACTTVPPPPTTPLHMPTTTPCGTLACNVESRSTGKKPPHLLPYPLGFAGTLPRICPENPTGIRHKARDNPGMTDYRIARNIG